MPSEVDSFQETLRSLGHSLTAKYRAPLLQMNRRALPLGANGTHPRAPLCRIHGAFRPDRHCQLVG
jgi:hypothetical protein